MSSVEQKGDNEKKETLPLSDSDSDNRSDDPFHMPLFDRRSRSFDRRGKGHWAVNDLLSFDNLSVHDTDRKSENPFLKSMLLQRKMYRMWPTWI
jgi:hypothetical protein